MNLIPTPCQQLDYKVGDTFRVIQTHCGFEQGQVVTLYRDDGTGSPLFKGDNTCYNLAGRKPGAYLSLTRVTPYNQTTTQEKVEMPQFKVGDEVRIVRDHGFEDHSVGQTGQIARFDLGDSSLPILVRFNDGSGSDWGRASGLEIVTAAVPVAVKSASFKVGDKVTVTARSASGFNRDRQGLTGIITRTDLTRLPVLVRFEDCESDWGTYKELTLADQIAKPLETKTIQEKLAAIDKLTAEIRELLG